MANPNVIRRAISDSAKREIISLRNKGKTWAHIATFPWEDRTGIKRFYSADGLRKCIGCSGGDTRGMMTDEQWQRFYMFGEESA